MGGLSGLAGANRERAAQRRWTDAAPLTRPAGDNILAGRRAGGDILSAGALA